MTEHVSDTGTPRPRGPESERDMIERVIYSPEAEKDVADAYSWYEAREPGLGEALAGVANRAQRCRWHLVDQLKYSLYQDGVKAPGQREPTQELAGLLAIDVPAAEFEQVQPEEKTALA